MLLQLCMLASLLWSFLRALTLLALSLPLACIRCASAPLVGPLADESAVFYEGEVRHERRKPVRNTFSYPVRMALVSLDRPLRWWRAQAGSFISAEEARNLAGTDGEVRLLTNPVTAGYVQNPISVYYCYNTKGSLELCIAEVTNTPWAAKVRFLFRPAGEEVPKALHVSPFMDMQSTWQLRASEPGSRLALSVAASHPELGNFFSADLSLRIAAEASLCSEAAGFHTLLKYGYQPHRDALLIYWQAVKLLWKGVPFYSPPVEGFEQKIEEGARNPRMSDGRRFQWEPAQGFPWKVAS